MNGLEGKPSAAVQFEDPIVDGHRVEPGPLVAELEEVEAIQGSRPRPMVQSSQRWTLATGIDLP